jgi:hypothetical protein
MFGNAFKPVFTGRFSQVNGQVVLTGRFGLGWFVKLFMTYWLGFCVLFVLLSLLAAAQKPAAAWMSLAGIGMFALGLGMTRLFAWFSRGDALWLAQVIRTALHAPVSPEAALALPASRPSDARPPFILVVTGVFCLFGVMCFVGALQGRGAGVIHVSGALIERYPQAVRWGAVVNGLMLLACAYGIYRRYLFAWWAGFVVLLLGQAYSVVDLFTRGDLGNARIPGTIFGVMSVIVVGFWGCWWHVQRVHFRRWKS